MNGFNVVVVAVGTNLYIPGHVCIVVVIALIHQHRVVDRITFYYTAPSGVAQVNDMCARDKNECNSYKALVSVRYTQSHI